jgi:hypothetical protein
LLTVPPGSIAHAGRHFLVARLRADGPAGPIVGFVNGTLAKERHLTHESMSEHESAGSYLCIHSVRGG